jgi:hypothetical protein
LIYKKANIKEKTGFLGPVLITPFKIIKYDFEAFHKGKERSIILLLIGDFLLPLELQQVLLAEF